MAVACREQATKVPCIPMQTMLQVLIVVLLSTSGLFGDDDEKRANIKKKTASNSEVQIRAEISKLSKHDWAGEYINGTWGDVRILLLAPDSGFVIERHGCAGSGERNYGVADAKDSRLRLIFSLKNPTEGWGSFPAEWTIVRWGERRYLVPQNHMLDFCNRVNQGSEGYFLRIGDDKKTVQGMPEVPHEYRDYLLSKPVEATIVAVGKATTRPSIADWNFKDTPVTIDAGSRLGLKKGMELMVTKPELSTETIRITRVEESRAEAIMTQILEESPGPQPGWRVSTRNPLIDQLKEQLKK